MWPAGTVQCCIDGTEQNGKYHLFFTPTVHVSPSNNPEVLNSFGVDLPRQRLLLAHTGGEQSKQLA